MKIWVNFDEPFLSYSAATMKKVSAGQMFHIIKNGSKGTGMVAHGKTLKDKEIWDVIKYIRTTFMK